MLERTILRGGVELAYVDGGAGIPPLVFIHGGLSSHHAFDPQLGRFSRTHRVLAPDLRGHGQSGSPGDPYSIETFADDVAAVCLDAGVSAAVVVGHSLGGLVGLELARRHEALVRKVMLVESPVASSPDQAVRSATLLSALRGPDYPTFVVEWAHRMVLPSAPHAERVTREMQATPQHVAVSLVEQMLAYDTAAAIAGCRAPISVIGGAVDSSRLREVRPDATVRPAVGGSHYGHLDEPKALNALIDEMLAS